MKNKILARAAMLVLFCAWTLVVYRYYFQKFFEYPPMKTFVSVLAEKAR